MEKCRIMECKFPANWHVWNPISDFDSFLCEEHMDSAQWSLVTEGRQGVESMNFYKARMEAIKSR